MSTAVKLAAAAAAALVAVGPAAAQNVNADPSYGTVNLNAGFTPDPYVVPLSSGGGINASNAIGGSCRGYIANNPDVRLNYSNGSFPLILSVAASADTTLVVNAPDGNWYCDDDGGDGLNPSIRFDRPMSGRYEIWVGTYGNSGYNSAELNISELYSQ